MISRRAWRAVATVAASLALVWLPAAAWAEVPPDATWTEAYFPSEGVTLHADVLRPKGLGDGDRTPVILAIGPYFAHCGSTIDSCDPTAEPPTLRFKDLIEEGEIFKRGYTLVQVDLRGFGASTGCNDFGGPGEQADVKAAVEWAASQPWSTGRVGMWGKSYDAWTEVMALATKPKGLAATVIMAPIIDGFRTLYMNGVHYGTGWYGTPALYQAIDAQPPTTSDSADYYLGFARGTDPACYSRNIAEQNGTIDKDAPFWQVRDLVPRAAGSDVPTLWTHGFMDANTKPDNFLDVYTTLTGPRRAWFGQWAHVRGNESNLVGRPGFMAEAMRWLDRYVKGVPPAEAPVEGDPPVVLQEADGRWRLEPEWPPADARRFDLPVKPGSYSDQPNNDAEGKTTGRTGVGAWTFTQPLPHDALLSGTPRLSVEVTSPAPRANLVALLYDVDPAAGRGTLITRGAFAVKRSGTVAFDLYPQEWRIVAGRRLGLLIAGADEDWWTPPHSGTTVQVSSGSLSVPFLSFKREVFVPGEPARAMRSRRPIPIAAGTISTNEAPAPLPGPMTEPPPGTVPWAPGVAGSPSGRPASRRGALSVRLRAAKPRGRRRARARRVLRATGRAPAGGRVVLQLRRGRRTVATRRVAIRRGAFRATFRVRAPGRYQLRAVLRLPTTVLRANSRRVRVR